MDSINFENVNDIDSHKKIKLKTSELRVKKVKLHIPTEADLLFCLEPALENNYQQVEIDFVECPDLSQPPYNLASEGLCGSPKLAEAGGVPYLIPGPAKYNEHVYSYRDVCKIVGLPDGLAIGATCSSPFVESVKSCAEVMPNTSAEKNLTHCARVNNDGESYDCKLYGSNEFTTLGNLCISKGQRGRCMKIKVKNRIGNKGSLTICLQDALKEKFKLPVGMGGVFVSLGKTKTKVHVMPQRFSQKPLKTLYASKKIDEWLQFYETTAPITHLATLISRDVQDFSFRTEHTHCFSKHNQGGHYHYDVGDKSEVEYEGYFVFPDTAFQIDWPE